LREAIRDVNTAVWLSRRLWRPVAADLLSRRPRRRGRRH